MHLTLQQLRLFHSVVRNGSYTRAAEEMHLTQPAVSIQIKRLEDQAGTPLLEQVGKKIFPTTAGKTVFAAASDVLARLAELDNEIEILKGEVRGPLQISVVTTGKYFMPHLLGRFLQQHPGVEPHLKFTNRARVMERLLANEDDFVVMGQVPDDDRLVLNEQGLVVEPYMELGSSEAIKQAVLAGIGIAVISLHSVRLEQTAGKLAVLDVEGFPIRRRWYAVHQKGKRLSLVAQTFLDFILAESHQAFAD